MKKAKEGAPEEIAGMLFAEPNVVIVKEIHFIIPLVGNPSELSKKRKEKCGQKQ